jgi:hypothetical protein
VADEVQVGELRDRVAERVVERAEGLLAAVEVHDRHAGQRRRQGGRRRLEPVADDDRASGRIAARYAPT